MAEADSADFCVGYFNLRGWGELADLSGPLSGDGEECVRVLVGMHRPPKEAMRDVARASRRDAILDPPTRARLQKRTSQDFKEQLQFGVPTDCAEAALRQLAQQLQSRKVRIRLFLQYALHAKLYLVHRTDVAAPLVGYVGSSNLTLAGLSRQGELNVDVLDQDSAQKLQEWFEQRWNHKHSIDISLELADLIESSWAREDLVAPYLVYVKMVYHLSREARQSEQEFKLPKDLQSVLLDFQAKAVFLAAHHLHVRDGVLLADVVGLGKTLMATAVAKITQEDEGGAALVICPPALVGMWNDYLQKYELAGQAVSLGMVTRVLPDLKRYRLLIIDESHNLRNREGARYRAIRDYIEENDPRCLLLTATPYNKEYVDIGNQLRLFIDERRDLGVRPERYFEQEDERDFAVRFQAPSRSLVAFEQSPYPEDWRDLLRLYMVRRTREFVEENYAQMVPSWDLAGGSTNGCHTMQPVTGIM